jgi:hypothetical protein
MVGRSLRRLGALAVTMVVVAAADMDAFGRKQDLSVPLADAGNEPHKFNTKGDLIKSLHSAETSSVHASLRGGSGDAAGTGASAGAGGHTGVNSAQSQGQFGRVMVVMADNRKVQPMDGKGIDEYWSLSYELNRRWACRHGYDITYYRFKDYYKLLHPTLSITGVVNPIAACKQDWPSTPSAQEGGDGGNRLWREAAYCKLAAFGDALISKDYDTVVWMDSDLFMEQPEVGLEELVRRFPPVKCKKWGGSACEPDGDARDAEFWFAENWPWDKAMPNSGFFIVRNKGLVHEALAAWWNVRELAHNGIFEQHSLWELIRSRHWITKHMALMPLKAMTPEAKGKSPLRHLESSQRKNRKKVLQAAVKALPPLEGTCGQVIDFDATQKGHDLFPASQDYGREGEKFAGPKPRKGAGVFAHAPMLGGAAPAAAAPTAPAAPAAPAKVATEPVADGKKKKQGVVVTFAYETPAHLNGNHNAVHYDKNTLAAFVLSARATMKADNVDVVLFVHTSQLQIAEFVAFAKEHDVTLLPVDAELHKQTIETGRIPILTRWLQKHESKYDFVALVDSKDVFFQRNCFDGLKQGEVHIFEQEVNVTFEADGFSPQLERMWINTVHRTLQTCWKHEGPKFIPAVEKELADPQMGMGRWLDKAKAAYTFGVLIGGMPAMTRAMEMVTELWGAVDECIKSGRPKKCAGCKTSNHGLDQGIINMMYYGITPSAQKGYKLVGHHSNTGAVTNVPCCIYDKRGQEGKVTCRAYDAFLKDGVVHNKNGPCAIVHQHDRCPGLANAMARPLGFDLPAPAMKHPECCAGAKEFDWRMSGGGKALAAAAQPAVAVAEVSASAATASSVAGGPKKQGAIVSFAYETPEHQKDSSVKVHYTPSSIAAFVLSARATMKADKVDFILFVHTSQMTQTDFVAFAKKYDVTLLPVDGELHKQTIETGRIPILTRWLQKHADEYDFVALTDSKDVFFQRNCFDDLEQSEVHIFEQEVNVTFTANGFSPQLERQWVQTSHRTVQECYKPPAGMKTPFTALVDKELGDIKAGMGWWLDQKAAFTFGVLLGGMKAMVRVMEVVDMLWTATDECIKTKRPKVCYGCKTSNHGLDQGILNLMFYGLHADLQKGYKLVGHHSDRGMLTNVPCCIYNGRNEDSKPTCRAYDAFLTGGIVHNRDGPCSIVHQHDRCPGLANAMAKPLGFELPPPTQKHPECCEGNKAFDWRRVAV